MRDPYDVLGVPKSAPAAEIKKAFRKLAKTHHPDRNPGDAKAQARFSEISGAYELLSDEDKRAQFDRGEIDAEGKPRFQGFGGGGGGGFNPGGSGGFENFSFRGGGGRAGAGGFAAEDIFSDLFSGMAGRGQARGAGGGRGGAPAGEDIAVEVKLPFVEWAKGTKARVELPTGKELEVSIPALLAEGKSVRLKGQGMPSPWGGAPGDALVTVQIEPHPQFRVDGNNIRVDVPITLYEAVLGGKVRVPTLDGPVEMNVPKHSSGNRTMRLKGRGLPAKSAPGDLLVSLRIVLPTHQDADLEAFAANMREAAPYDPRKNA
ncbi:J domain-containing protein [Terrihabitans rhizophilus]|uniref:J domain-containing protein n=1 Tax=Terrihabitans rhizophilus TaxID=3092662 RepID=A0ABU4RMH7_9HYPH|nr:J domain-containing protein [Terrihabitans sp. PJ23]MDX6806029.1 J domain-containing protein [Terrihabitans sp. PJ23]